jgi:hypothetical protein
MEKLEQAGVMKRVATCECACNIVLVEQGQSGQDYRMCSNFVDLNPHTEDLQYPLQEPASILDESRDATCWSVLDIKACFHNFPIVEHAKKYLGHVTQDGLW